MMNEYWLSAEGGSLHHFLNKIDPPQADLKYSIVNR